MNKILKWLLLSLGIAIGAYTITSICKFIFFIHMFAPFYSKKDLIENYELKTKEIYALKRYAEMIIPSGKKVHIEFESDNTLGIFHLYSNKTSTNNWNLSINSSKTDSLLTELGWTKKTLATLKEKLDDANCISIENEKPFNIGFQRSGMGLYFYNLFDKPLTDSLKKEYNDGCTYILYNDKVVLEYGGGAVGPQCFEKRP